MGNIKSRSLYLRIASQAKLFEDTILYKSEDMFTKLASLRKNAEAYLRLMESEGLDDKYREVYKINENLQNYPSDKQAWIAEKKRRNTEQQQREAEIKAKNDAFVALFTKDMILIEGGTFMMGSELKANPKFKKKMSSPLSGLVDIALHSAVLK